MKLKINEKYNQSKTDKYKKYNQHLRKLVKSVTDGKVFSKFFVISRTTS